jgi:hypothetical protein
MLLFACLFGAAAVIHVPVLLMLFLHQRRIPAEKLRRIAYAFAALMPLTGIGLVAVNTFLASSPLEHYVIPLSSVLLQSGGAAEGTDHYTLLSALHLQDVVNAIWLLAGPSLVAILALAVPPWEKDFRLSPQFQISLVAFSASVTFLFFANGLYGLSQDWDLLAIISPAFLFAAAAMASGHMDGRSVVPAVTAGLLLLQAGQLYPWIRVNAAEASAERFASLVSMNSGVVPPWNTFRSLENLRSYRASTGNSTGEFDALRQQFALGIRNEQIFRTMQITFPRLPEQDQPALLDSMLILLLRATNSKNANTAAQAIDATRLREFAASTLLLASSAEAHECAQRYVGEFGRRFVSWPEVGLYYAAANPRLTDNQRLEIVSMSLRPDSRDPSLTSTAGWFCEKAGDFVHAAEFHQRTITLAPGEYPTLYVRLAQILHDEIREYDAAIRILEQGISECSYAGERTEMLKLLETYRLIAP